MSDRVVISDLIDLEVNVFLNFRECGIGKAASVAEPLDVSLEGIESDSEEFEMLLSVDNDASHAAQWIVGFPVDSACVLWCLAQVTPIRLRG